MKKREVNRSSKEDLAAAVEEYLHWTIKHVIEVQPNGKLASYFADLMSFGEPIVRVTVIRRPHAREEKKCANEKCGQLFRAGSRQLYCSSKCCGQVGTDKFRKKWGRGPSRAHV